MFLRKYATRLLATTVISILLAPTLFNLKSKATQTQGQSNCSEGWYITGYYVPREDELPDTTEQVTVERVGDIGFSQQFLTEIRTEGWGITRFGWALGYYSNAWHRSDAGPLDASGKPLTDGAIANRSLGHPTRRQCADRYVADSVGVEDFPRHGRR